MEFKILCDKGDAAYDYDSVTAEIKFDELKGSGMLPMKIEGGKSVPMKSFDAQATAIMWVPAIMGG